MAEPKERERERNTASKFQLDFGWIFTFSAVGAVSLFPLSLHYFSRPHSIPDPSQWYVLSNSALAPTVLREKKRKPKEQKRFSLFCLFVRFCEMRASEVQSLLEREGGGEGEHEGGGKGR